MPSWMLLVLLSLSCARLTRLVVKDDLPLVFYPREKIIRMRPDHEMRPAGKDSYENHWWLGELLSCHWCASAYVSAGLVTGTWVVLHGHGGLPLPILWWLSTWALGAALVHHFG